MEFNLIFSTTNINSSAIITDGEAYSRENRDSDKSFTPSIRTINSGVDHEIHQFIPLFNRFQVAQCKMLYLKTVIIMKKAMKKKQRRRTIYFIIIFPLNLNILQVSDYYL